MACGCPVVVAQWQSTGGSSQELFIQFPVTAGFSTFLYFAFYNRKLSLVLHVVLVGLSHLRYSKERFGTPPDYTLPHLPEMHWKPPEQTSPYNGHNM